MSVREFARSVRFTHWPAYFVPWAIVVVLLAAYFHHSRVEFDLAQLKVQDQATVGIAVSGVNRVVQQIGRDLFYLADDNQLKRTLDEPTSDNLRELTANFANFARGKRIYDQISWLDESGRERGRVNFAKGEAAIVPAGRLQDQGRRDYFSDASRLSAGQLYVSPLELDSEGGRVETPYKPTLRIATPVFGSEGERRGILVLNYLATDLLERYAAIMSAAKGRAMLVNGGGYWLYSAAKGDEWGFMFQREASIASRHPKAWARIAGSERGQFEDGDGLWTFETIFPLLEGGKAKPGARPDEDPGSEAADSRRYFWKAIVVLPDEALSAIRGRLLPETALATVVALFLLFMGSVQLARARARQADAEADLRRLNQNLERNVAERTRQLQHEVFDRQMAERRYRESAEQYQHMLANLRDAYWLYDRYGSVLDVNSAACEMLGYGRDELINLQLCAVDAAASPAEMARHLEKIVADGHDRFESRHRCKDGTLIDVEVSASYLPEYERCVALVRDITARKRADAERRLAALVLDHTDEGVVVCRPDLRIETVNPAFTRITGYAALEVVGKPPTVLGISPGELAFEVFVADVLRGIDSAGAWRGEVWSRRRSGELYPAWVAVSVVRDESGRPAYYVAVFSDITQIKESQKRLDFLAHHDGLTGLPNRLLFSARLEHSLERARRENKQIAVVFLDLDHFKEVNDSLGHAVGDQLLKDLAVAMSERLRAEDTLARLGGDEFLILLEDVADAASVEAVLEKFEQIFPWHVPAGGHVIAVTASIGASVFPADGGDAQTLVQRADSAMYAAKDAGRACHCFAAAQPTAPRATSA